MKNDLHYVSKSGRRYSGTAALLHHTFGNDDANNSENVLSHKEEMATYTKLLTTLGYGYSVDA